MGPTRPGKRNEAGVRLAAVEAFWREKEDFRNKLDINGDC